MESKNVMTSPEYIGAQEAEQLLPRMLMSCSGLLLQEGRKDVFSPAVVCCYIFIHKSVQCKRSHFISDVQELHTRLGAAEICSLKVHGLLTFSRSSLVLSPFLISAVHGRLFSIFLVYRVTLSATRTSLGTLQA